MVEERQRGMLSQILELLDTACQANLELLELYCEGETEPAQTLLTDLRSVVQAVASAQEPLLPQLEHAYTTEMLENAEDTLDDIQRSIESGNSDRAAMKMEFQLFPFLRCLREAFYFYGMVCPNPDRMKQYYQDDFAKAYQNFYVTADESPELRLSIVITGYNHLETTKQCVEQLLKETDFEKLNAELILIDHGSTDGTLEYFESLNVGKVIHFKKNARMNMFAALFQMCRGKYFSFVSNDILVTRNWADILLNCLESDEKIIAAVPATPNIANLQTIGLPELGPKEYIAWANQQNRPDPSRWNDRVRLMPPLGMYRTEAVNRIGFADPYLYSMEYWDDDFSFRARRAGYRQILCNDVSCYHFGSVTGKEGQKTEGTLVYGRELFLKKNGVDAWGSGFCFDYPAVQLLMNTLPQQGPVDILGLDCGMGDTPLQIRNELRHRHQEGQICQLTCQEQYLPDVKPHSQEAYFEPDLTIGLQKHFSEKTFYCVYLGQDIGKYMEPAKLLEVIAKKMISGGCLVFFCDNPFFAVNLHQLLQFSLPENREQWSLADPNKIREAAERFFSQVQMVAVEQNVAGIKEFVQQHYGKTKQAAQAEKQMAVQKYFLVCRK